METGGAGSTSGAFMSDSIDDERDDDEDADEDWDSGDGDRGRWLLEDVTWKEISFRCIIAVIDIVLLIERWE